MIGPVMLQGITQTVQEVSAIKAHENAKPQEDQVGLQHIGQKETDHKRETVVRKSDPAFEQHQKHDAKEKGKGEYYNPNQHNKKKHTEEDEDGVIIKKEKSFDVKI